MKRHVFRYSVTFLTDWHIGSGIGIPGSVDRLVIRDPVDGLPYLPATTLTGIWRDSCERVAKGLANEWPEWIPHLFGAETTDGLLTGGFPSAKRVAIGPARLSSDLRGAIVERPAMREAVTHIVPGVAIEEKSGRARDKHLRFVEVARAGAVLEGTIEIEAEADASGSDAPYLETVEAVLRAGASWIERLGGKRRRGWGRCVVTLHGALSDKEVVARLRQAAPPRPSSRKSEWRVSSSSPARGPAPTDWSVWDVDVLALSPLVIADRQVGNLVVTRRDIPGSQLLPLVLRAMRHDGMDVDAAARAGELIVTDASPFVAGTPGRPAPRSLVRDKKAPGLGGSYTNSFLSEPIQGDDIARQTPAGAFVGGFATGDERLPVWGRPQVGATTHNVIEGRAQRPVAPGGLFTYEWLAPGTRLRFQIRLRDHVASTLSPSWCDRLSEHAGRVGRSRRDEYGQVALKVGEGKPVAPELRDDNLLFVWLLSDLLLRDERLRPDASEPVLRHALGRALKVDLRLQHVDGRAQVYLSPSRRDSWSERWGLPRSSMCGATAGCAVVYEIHPLTGATLDRVALTRALGEVANGGLGERCAEGFGQLSFNDPLVMTALTNLPPRDVEVEAPAAPAALVARGSGSYQYAEVVERAAWRAEIARAAEREAERVHTKMRFTPEQPGSAQLGALRMMAGAVFSASAADRDEARARALAWLDRLAEGKRREPWRNSLPHVREIFEDRATVWRLLNKAETWRALTLTDGGLAVRQGELWGEAVHAIMVEAIRFKPDTQRGKKKEGASGATHK